MSGVALQPVCRPDVWQLWADAPKPLTFSWLWSPPGVNIPGWCPVETISHTEVTNVDWWKYAFFLFELYKTKTKGSSSIVCVCTRLCAFAFHLSGALSRSYLVCCWALRRPHRQRGVASGPQPAHSRRRTPVLVTLKCAKSKHREPASEMSAHRRDLPVPPQQPFQVPQLEGTWR